MRVLLAATTLLFLCLADPGNSRKDCLGTDNKLSRIRDLSKHYQNMRKRYLNCELVRGNLEITFIDQDFDLSFLQSIREVSGYVLVAMSTASRIPLDNLMLIRGNNLYQNKYALVIVVNENSISGVGVEQLGLSNLTEILLGSVLIRGNMHLCYVDTIIWEDMQDSSSKGNFTNKLEFHSNNCHPCHESCNNHCWGPLSTDCQKLQRTKCAAHCDRYCIRGHEDQCCHANCASGCFVPRDARMCYACRLFNNSGECVEHCPKPEIYNPAMSMMTPNPDVKYSYGAACVKQCPGHFVVDYNSCVRSCPANKVEVEDKSGRKVCSLCSGICEKTCSGVKNGDLWNYVNAKNVHQFKDCTTISGNLLFRGISFDGDRFHKIPPMNSSDLEVFKTIRRITGYLHIESWHKDLKDLSVLENLEIIEGRELTYREYALILVHLRNVESLNLHSLKEIDAGGVMIKNNDHLCFYNTINWTVILQSDGKLDLALPSTNCSKFSRSFGLQLCDPQCLDNHCWGPGPSQCFQCRQYKRQRTCVESCNLDNSLSPEFIDAHLCLPCDPECRTVMDNLSCHGAGPHNCTQCLHYRDGKQCLAECPNGVTAENENLIYKYPDADNICRLCHVNCTQGCDGPTLKECNDYIEIQNNRVVIVVAAVLGLLLAVFLLLIGGLAYRRQKNVQRKNTLRKYVERELTQPLTPSGAAPNQAQLHIIKETEIKKGRVLGSGAFGTVFKGSWTPEGETTKIPVAIKVLKEEASPKANNEVLDALPIFHHSHPKEAYVMASVAHPYLVRLLGVCLIPSLQLVTQLMPLGCLLDYTRQNQQRIGSQLLLNWAVQIAKGMFYLEERRLVHRDLAARNVLVKNPEHVAITDFGLTRLLDINQVEYKADGGKLPIKWMALESINERKFTHKSDVWSYGVTVWELVTFGEKPYDGIRAQNLPYLLQKGERLPQPPICTIDVYMVMIKCWIIEPDDRPGFNDLTTEFSRMARDPTRFLVLEADKGGKLLSPRDLLEKDKQEANDSIMIAETVPFTLKLPPEGRRRQRNPKQSDARAGAFSSGKQLQRSTSQPSTGRAAAFANGKSNSSLKYTPRSERYLHGSTFPFDNRLEELSSQTAADWKNPEYQALSEATSPLPVTRLPSNPFSDMIDGFNQPLPISHSEKIPSSEYVAVSAPKEKGTFNNPDYINTNTHQVVLDNPEYHHTNGIARTPIAVNPDYRPVALAWPADRTNSHISTDV